MAKPKGSLEEAMGCAKSLVQETSVDEYRTAFVQSFNIQMLINILL